MPAPRLRRLASQLTWHWEHQLRPRLSGLTDAEYLWEPVEGCWSIRARPDGAYTLDWAFPAPEPAPLTTIAWRLAHIGQTLAQRVGVAAQRRVRRRIDQRIDTPLPVRLLHNGMPHRLPACFRRHALKLRDHPADVREFLLRELIDAHRLLLVPRLSWSAVP